MIQHKTTELMQKGSAADIFTPRSILVSIKWNGPAVFDLAAVCADKAGNTALAYSENAGSPNEFPYVSCCDGCFGDISPDNEEAFRIIRPEMLSHVWILCWDYEKIQKNLPAEFRENNLFLKVTDYRENIFEIHLDNDAPANIALIADIDNSGLPGAKIINRSHTGRFDKLKNLEQLMDFIRQGQKDSILFHPHYSGMI